ncbi:MAG: TonB-dependent receptor, partial [Candidatus Marinimicrobia bacterium]|nr:TonB-dependent receptor [Candidatus Neomarinimicrobiota bacterium]
MKFFRGLLLLTLLCGLAYGQTSGKIMGTVTDQNGNPLAGANVIVNGTVYGAAANEEGFYVILNVPPGVYSVTASYIGYASLTQAGVRVEIDLTTNVDFALKPQAFQGETITVVAERKVLRVDVASSQTNLSSEQIEDLPASSLEDVIGMQAGVSGLEVRQGGVDELAYLMDGVSLKDDRTGQPVTGVPLSSVQEIMIQSGGFNAEYSDLQAGVVNVVTKEGRPDRYSFDAIIKYSPPAPKHFGMSIYDPMSIYMRPWLDDDVAWWGTEPETFTDVNKDGYWDPGEPFVDRNGDGEYYYPWDEHIRKMYPSFQGWNQTSSDLLSNDNPSDDLSPTGAQQLFKWQRRRQGDITEPDYNIDFGLGGPVPFVSQYLGNLRFYTSFRKEKSMYLIPLSRDAYNEWSLSTKVTSDITERIKFQLTAFHKETKASSSSETGLPSYFSDPIWDVAGAFGSSSQQRAKIFYPSYYCKTDIWNDVVSAKVTQQLSGKSYHEALIEYRATEYLTRPIPPRDFTPRYNILPGTEGEDQYLVDEAPWGFDTQLTTGIDGFMMGAKSNARDSTKTWAFKARWDFISQVNRNNQIKTGLQFEYFNYKMNYGAINPALPAGRPWTKWEKSPWQLGAYIQDKMEFEGWIATVGLRAEYFNPNTDWYDYEPFDKNLKILASREVTPEDNLPMKRAKGLFTLMPRIGISHPITVNSKLYFNYGHMRQRFSPDQLFGVRRVYGASLYYLGDPELPMEKTIAYELGYDHSLFEQYLIHIAAYYKDKSDQAT